MKNSIVSSLIYKFLERSGVQGISFVFGIILARLLSPSDYGIIALLMVFIAVSEVFVQSGLNTALIQKLDADNLDFSSVFFTNIVLSLLIYLLLFFSAPFIAEFYHLPSLKKAFRVLALVIFPGAINSIQIAKISREMQFQKLLKSSVGAVLLSGIIGIILAYYHAGMWALIAQQLSNQVFIMIIMFFTVKWKPSVRFSFSRLKKLFSFGWKLLVSSLLDTLYQNLRSLVIGKKYDASTLGYYNRGNQFPKFLISNINGSIQSVMLPAMSSKQLYKDQVKSLMRRGIVTSSFFVLPMMVGLAVVARPLVIVLLTEKWIQSVPYLQVMSFSFALYPIHSANLQAINAMGRSDIFLKLEIIKKIYGIAILAIAVFFFKSPLAIAISGVFASLISSFVNANPNKNLLDYSYGEQIKDLFPSFIISLLMGALIFPISLLISNSLLLLITQIIAGVIIYLVLAIVFKLESFQYVVNLIKPIIRKPRNRDKG